MNMGVQISESLFSILLRIYPEMELLDLLGFLFLIFWEISILFSTVAAPFYIPTSNECTRVLISPHSSQHFLYSVLVFFLITVILLDMKQYLNVVLICISLMISDVECLFMCLLATYILSLEECLFKSFADFLIGFFCCCWAVGVLYIFWILIPCETYDLQMFSPILRVVFWSCL